MSQNSGGNTSADLNAEQIADQSQSSITTTPSMASSSPTTSLQSLSISTSASEKNEKFKITLDNPTNTYYSGETIRGTISLFCKQRKKIRGIYFRIIGYGKCSWTDWLRRESVTVDGKGERSFVQYSGTEEYLNSTMYIVGSKNGPSFTLLSGTTTYEFCFNLKTDLPSSFSGGCGKIKYKLEFIVDKPWKFDEKQTVALSIIQRLNLNYAFGTLQPFENQLTRNIGYIGSGPISLHCFIPKAGYVAGERIPVQVIVSNNSRIHVDKVKFALNKVVDYHSMTPGVAIKREIQRLLKKEAGGVAKKTEQRYEHVIDVPVTTPSQDSRISRLIYITYELRVEVKLGGLYKNLVITIPLTVGTIPHSANGVHQSIAFPALPDLPTGLTVRPPLPLPIDTRRLSISSNTSFRSNTSSHNNSSVSTSAQSEQSAQNNLSNTSILNDTNLWNTSASSSSAVSNCSAISNDTSNSSTATSSTHEFRPTAPPMDLTATNPSPAPIRSSTVYVDAPPSYDEVFGSTNASSGNQLTLPSSSVQSTSTPTPTPTATPST